MSIQTNAGSLGVGGTAHLGQAARFDLDNPSNNDYAVSISTNANGADAAGLNVQSSGSADALQVRSSVGGYALSVIGTNDDANPLTPNIGGGAIKLSYNTVPAAAAITMPTNATYVVIAPVGGVQANVVATLADLGVNDAGRILIVTNNDDDVVTYITLKRALDLTIVAGVTVQLIWDGNNWHAM